MTDYAVAIRRSRRKLVALSLLKIRPVNALAVRVLRALPQMEFRRRVPVLGAAARMSVGEGDVFMTAPDRCEVAKELFWGDGQLHSAADRLSLDLAIGLSKGADIFLDVGAYTGLFALAVARANPGLAAHAFEIVPENYLLLWQNVIANDLVGRVEPRLLGVGAAPGSLRVPATFGAGVLASSVALDSESVSGVAVPVTSLDALFPDLRGKMVMKIDVEGFEWPVLRGATELITRVGPDMICEVLVRAQDCAAVEGFLAERNYRLYRITESGLLERPTLEPVRKERDWLFTRKLPAELRERGWTVRDS